MTFGFDIDSTPAQSALRALDLGAKFQIVAIRILRETEGLKEIRGTTKGTFRYQYILSTTFICMKQQQVCLNVYRTIEIP